MKASAEKPMPTPSVWLYEEYEVGDLVCSGCGNVLMAIVYKGMAVSYREGLERRVRLHLEKCKQTTNEHQRTRQIPA